MRIQSANNNIKRRHLASWWTTVVFLGLPSIVQRLSLVLVHAEDYGPGPPSRSPTPSSSSVFTPVGGVGIDTLADDTDPVITIDEPLAPTQPLLAASRSSISGHAYLTNSTLGYGMNNVSVDLFTCTGNIINTTKINASGHYSFEELYGGRYFISSVPPQGYVFSNIWDDYTNETESLEYLGGESAVNPDPRSTECFDLKDGEDKTVSFGMTFNVSSNTGPMTTASPSELVPSNPPSHELNVSSNPMESASPSKLLEITSEPSNSPITATLMPPSEMPSLYTSRVPSNSPTTLTESQSPSTLPSREPSLNPTSVTSKLLSNSPTAPVESLSPSKIPSHEPSLNPTSITAELPSVKPTALAKSQSPPIIPSHEPSLNPTPPSEMPSLYTSRILSNSPTALAESQFPSTIPSCEPSLDPTPTISQLLSNSPTAPVESQSPSKIPSHEPSLNPTSGFYLTVAHFYESSQPTPNVRASKIPSASPSQSVSFHGPTTTERLLMTIRGIRMLQDEEAWSVATSDYIMSYFNLISDDPEVLDVTVNIEVTKQTSGDDDAFQRRRPHQRHPEHQHRKMRRRRGLESDFDIVEVMYSQTSVYKTSNSSRYDEFYVATAPFFPRQGSEGYVAALRDLSPYYKEVWSVGLVHVDNPHRMPIGEGNDVTNKDRVGEVQNPPEEENQPSTNGNEGKGFNQLYIIVAVGCALLAFVRARLDKKKPTTRTTTHKKFNVIAPAGRLGIIIETPPTGSSAFVSEITEACPIAGQIKLGDRIIAVDDEDVQNMLTENVSKLLIEKHRQEERKITVLRKI